MFKDGVELMFSSGCYGYAILYVGLPGESTVE